MFNVRKHPSLWLILTALFVTVCRCSVGQAPDQTTSDGVTIPICRHYIDTSTGNGISPGTGITCSIECPRPPGTVIRDFYISDESKIRLGDMTHEQLKQQACLGGEEGVVLVPVAQNSSTSASSETAPTEPPTEEPAATEPPTEPALTSILGGKVSYCSVTADQYYMNLPFNSGANPAQVQQELDSGALKVVISGTTTEGRCKVLASNNMLLCAYPSGSFPAFSSSATNTILNVVHNGTIIDVLPFNNYCEGLQSVNGGGDDSSTEENGSSGGSVPACDPHFDPSCPVDCSNPSNADLCG